MNELPKDCVLPVGVEWCGEDGFLVVRGVNEHGFEDVIEAKWLEPVHKQWVDLFPEERPFVAARCAMWWGNKAAQMLNDDAVSVEVYELAHDTATAWAQLCRELEGAK